MAAPVAFVVLAEETAVAAREGSGGVAVEELGVGWGAGEVVVREGFWWVVVDGVDGQAAGSFTAGLEGVGGDGRGGGEEAQHGEGESFEEVHVG